MLEWLSIDIETTGLVSTRHQMIEFGCVWDRGGDGVASFRALVLHPDYVMNPYCVTLHTGLFAEINALPDLELHVICDDDVAYSIACSYGELGALFRGWLLRSGWDAVARFNVTGKNYATFDAAWVAPMLEDADVQVRSRVIDPAILYVRPGDNCLPDLDTCMQRAGLIIEGKRHTAVYDALCVSRLLRRAGL